jgi:hypothetical protein
VSLIPAINLLAVTTTPVIRVCGVSMNTSFHGGSNETIGGRVRFWRPQGPLIRAFGVSMCSARDWDRIRITWGNPQSGCSDICSYSKRATVGVRAPM